MRKDGDLPQKAPQTNEPPLGNHIVQKKTQTIIKHILFSIWLAEARGTSENTHSSIPDHWVINLIEIPFIAKVHFQIPWNDRWM